jgi:hypothetical protein
MAGGRAGGTSRAAIEEQALIFSLDKTGLLSIKC